MELLKEFFVKVDFEEKNQQTPKNMKNVPGGKELFVSSTPGLLIYCIAVLGTFLYNLLKISVLRNVPSLIECCLVSLVTDHSLLYLYLL